MFNYRIIHKSVSLIEQVPIKNGLEALFIENRKSFTEVPPPPMTKLIFLHTVVCFTFHKSHKNGMIGHGGGGRCQNAQKQFIIKIWN